MRKVYILEDNKEVLNQLSLMMKNENWDVFSYYKVEGIFSNFREYVDGHNIGPDLLLVDLFMPGFPLNRIAAMTFEEFAWLLPLYGPVSRLNKQKEWGGLIFLRKVKKYIEGINKKMPNNKIKMSKVITYSKLTRLLEDPPTKYLKNLALEIKHELIEEIGIEESNIIPKPDIDKIVQKANLGFNQEA